MNKARKSEHRFPLVLAKANRPMALKLWLPVIAFLAGILALASVTNLQGAPAQIEENKPAGAVRFAVLGDQGLGPNAVKVLQLILAEGADAVVHSGDFSYLENDLGPPAWDQQITDTLGDDFAYFPSFGNHDVGPAGARTWPAY